MRLLRTEIALLTAKVIEQVIDGKKKKMEVILGKKEIGELLERLDAEYEGMSEEMKSFLGRYGDRMPKPSEFVNAKEKACFALGESPVNPFFHDAEAIKDEIVYLSILAKDVDDLKKALNEVIEYHVNEKKHNKLLHEMLS